MEGLLNQTFVICHISLQEEEEAAAQVFQEFVASFDDAGKNINRAWVKGGTVNPGEGSDRKGSQPYFVKAESKWIAQKIGNSREACSFALTKYPLHFVAIHSDKPAKASRLYKPTSKLAELASTFKSSKEDKKEERHRERDRERNRDQDRDASKPVSKILPCHEDLWSLHSNFPFVACRLPVN